MSEYWQKLYERFETADEPSAALYAIAISLDRLADKVRDLGNGNAATEMGAIENLAVHLGHKLEVAGDAIAGAIREVADAVPNGD